MSIHTRSFAIAVLLGLFTAAESATAIDADPIVDGGPIVIVGTGFGAIADSPAMGTVCGAGNEGVARDISFAAVVPAGVDIVSVQLSLTITHTWAGDITATLIDPSGTRIAVMFGRVGALTATACGDDSNLAGPYIFSDLAVSTGFWQAATAAGAAAPIAADTYRSTNSGGAGAVNPAPPTSIDPVFAGMTAAQATGTWTLRVVDSGDGDLGTVNDASLSLFVGPSDIIFADGFDSPPN
jgi:hypothetical protein